VWLPIKLLKLGKETADLENEDNVFSLFVAAHLETLATRKDLAGRQQAKLRLLGNLQQRKMDAADGREWYRLIDFLMKLPEEMNQQVHQELYRQHAEEPMKYVSFAERQGIEKGEKQEARKNLRAVMNAKFGADGIALVDALGEGADLARLESLLTAAALARSFDDIRADFESTNGSAPRPAS
jgi:hypothetical protein